MKLAIFGAALFATVSSANASCLFTTSLCYEDSYGNSYRTERNLGGSYTTYQNNTPYSTTRETYGGGWQERRLYDGETRSFNYNPYDTGYRSKNYGYR